MVEFALSIPYLFFIFVTILYFGRYFLVAQVVLQAAQEGAKLASRTPDLAKEDVRNSLRGFTTDGAGVNPSSAIYAALGAGNLLSGGQTGNMPQGSQILILPFDSASDSANLAPGTVAVKIEYPFQLMGSIFAGPTPDLGIKFSADGSGQPFLFPNFTITEEAVAAQEIYQSTN
jgi:Flp pilus assembly protein TadG